MTKAAEHPREVSTWSSTYLWTFAERSHQVHELAELKHTIPVNVHLLHLAHYVSVGDVHIQLSNHASRSVTDNIQESYLHIFALTALP